MKKIKKRNGEMTKIFKKVIFGGYYGMKNVGDDCFGVVSTWGSRKYWNAKDVYLLSRTNLNSIIETKNCLYERRRYKGQNTINAYLNILESSLMVWAGGSILHSWQKTFSPYRFSFILSALDIVPVGAIGVSLGPYKTVKDEKYIHTSLKSFRFLALRDSVSYEEAMSLNLPYRPVRAADIALLLPKVVNLEPASIYDVPILGISVCHYERFIDRNLQHEKKRERILLESLILLIKNGFVGIFRFYIFNGNQVVGDKEITCFFADELKKNGATVEVFDYICDPITVWKNVSECTAFISVRLHGSIFSAAANVPCISIEYHKKCSDFVRDIGIDQNWIVGDLDCGPNELANKLSDILEKKHTTFYPNRDKLIEMSERNFTATLECI